MDPNANLLEQAQLLDCESARDKARRRELRETLADWLDRGGFPPTWKAAPDASKAFRKWRRMRAQFVDLVR